MHIVYYLNQRNHFGQFLGIVDKALSYGYINTQTYMSVEIYRISYAKYIFIIKCFYYVYRNITYRNIISEVSTSLTEPKFVVQDGERSSVDAE